VALCQCLALASIPLAVAAIAYAFYHGGRKMLAWIAWFLLTAQLSFVAIGMAVSMPEGRWIAPTIDIFVVGSLAWWGIANRHRRPAGQRSREPRRQWVESPVPTAITVTPEEAVGAWQFYVDAASSTVTLELRRDGTFGQSIVDNRGERRECQGGTWRLDGAWLDLDGYRALSGMLQQARWFFGDTPGGRCLFVNDALAASGYPLQAMKVATEGEERV
jgi:hypothetical protein